MINNIEVLGDLETTIKSDEEIVLELKKNANITLKIYPNLNVTITNIFNSKTSLNLKLNILILENSIVHFNNLDLKNDSQNVKMNIEISDNAKIQYKSIVISNNVSKKYDINLINTKENSKGQILQKAVVKNSGEVRFSTTGEIKKIARNSENYQDNKILLLDKASLGEVSPILLINNEDVIAGHKAVVSQVDEDALYYLQTRSISKKEAQKLLTFAFLNSVISEMKIDNSIKEKIKEELNV